jgi:hypothetical protein
MKRMHESKLNAEFQVVDKLACKKLSARVSGAIPLIEHQYDEDLSFWHGVAEVAIPLSALTQRPPEHAWVERVNLFLDDGRAGQCHVLTFQAQGGASGEYSRIQLVGLSELAKFDEHNPHFAPAF